jgi:hypothetical protein
LLRCGEKVHLLMYFAQQLNILLGFVPLRNNFSNFAWLTWSQRYTSKYFMYDDSGFPW